MTKQGLIVDETVPQGLTILDANGGERSVTRHLQWFEGDASETIIYKYKLNTESEGTYNFTGKYVAETDTTEQTIIGNNSIVVEEVIPACTEDDWTDTNGACQPDNTLTITWEKTGNCEGGTHHDPTEQIDCNYDAPTCTSFTYTEWSPATCPSTGQQTRNKISQSPTGCSGGNPSLTRTCTYIPQCTEEDWNSTEGECQPSNTKIVTWEKRINCEGGTHYDPTEQVDCNYDAPTCTSFTYNDWSTCRQVSGTIGIMTRTINTKLPNGCDGGERDLQKDCNYIPTCTDSYWSYTLGECDNNTQTKTWEKTADCNGGTYHPQTEQVSCSSDNPTVPYCGSDDWESRIEPQECPSTGLQTRYWTKNADCQGGLIKQPQETVNCTPSHVPPTTQTCTSFTYSDWSSCSTSGNRTRSILTKIPTGCTGGNPITTKNCNDSSGCEGEECNGNCYEEDGICCNGNWNTGINSCNYDISLIVSDIEQSGDKEAIQMIRDAEQSIEDGEILKAKAQTKIAILKTKIRDNPELQTIYEKAILALEQENYYEAEQLAINALTQQDTNNFFELKNPLTQIIIILIIITGIITISFLILGKNKNRKKGSHTKKEQVSEEQKIFNKIKKEFK